MTTVAVQKRSEREPSRAASPERTRSRPYYLPRVDILELPEELVLVAEMPGVSKDGLDIRFENGQLSITGRVEDRQPEGTKYLWRDYECGDYHRTFNVSEIIDVERIHAEYRDGELTLRLPKVEKARPRKIEVKTK